MSDEPQTYGERLQWAMKLRGVKNQSELARRIGIKPQSIQHLLDPKKNAQGSSYTAMLATELKISAHWLANGEGPRFDASPSDLPQGHVLEALKKVVEMLPDPTHTPRAIQILKGVALDMSQARNYPAPPRLTWEGLMGATFDQPFELEVMDGAFGEDFPPGCWMLLDPARAPRAGWPALVKDRDGQFYLRDYVRGAGDQWQAIARARGFLPLDSFDHGLEIIAVMKGVSFP
jgi:hypothetical protein